MYHNCQIVQANINICGTCGMYWNVLFVLVRFFNDIRLQTKNGFMWQWQPSIIANVVSLTVFSFKRIYFEYTYLQLSSVIVFVIEKHDLTKNVFIIQLRIHQNATCCNMPFQHGYCIADLGPWQCCTTFITHAQKLHDFAHM